MRKKEREVVRRREVKQTSAGLVVTYTGWKLGLTLTAYVKGKTQLERNVLDCID